MVRSFYSIAPTQVIREDVSSAQVGGNAVIPAFLIGRLALDRSIHGEGLGVELLLDALETVVAAARSTGGRLIVVDALNGEARAFDLKNGFADTRSEGRLVMKVSTAATLAP